MDGSLIIPGATSDAEKVSLVDGGALLDVHLSPIESAVGVAPAMQAFVRALAREAARSAFRAAAEAPASTDIRKK